MTHRLAFAAALCAALGSVACSSNTSNNSEDTGAEDTGSTDDTSTTDSSGGDTGSSDTGKTDTGTPTDSTTTDGETGGDADAGDAPDPDAAEVSDTCTTPGKTESGACGKCGTRERLCGSDKKWLPWGACTGETGTCSIGETRDVKCGKCGTRKDKCNATCDWDNGVCTGEGICNEGDVETQYSCSSPKLVKTRTCTSTCTWSDWSACAAPKGWDTMADPPGSFLGRRQHTAVWNSADGSMIVYGGYGSCSGTYCSDAASYKPSTDAWTSLPSPALSGRYQHTAVWTGTEMIVWGGTGSTSYMADGARFNPTSGTWTTLPAPPSGFVGRYAHTAVWTGTEMVIFGGYSGSYLATGAAYKPSTNTWRTIPSVGAPTGRYYHTAAYVGGKMFIYGGYGSCTGTYCADAFSYDPAADTWTTLAAPPITGRYYHTATLSGATGNLVTFWGGTGSASYAGDGATFDPSTTSWTAISSADTVVLYGKRYNHAAWFGGGKFYVWGGYGSTSYIPTGGIYNPATSTWTAMPDSGAPSGRYNHTAVWTGSEAIVWGGYGSAGYLRDGKIFRP